MRSASITALLLAVFACGAQPPLSRSQPLGSLHPGNLVRVADVPGLSEPAVTICLVTDPNRLIVRAAEALTDQMFAKVRVRLQWHEPPVCPGSAGDPVFLMLVTSTPETYFPRALGAALPAEGIHAWVFYDRVLGAGLDDNYVAAVLAHAMAHEIAHLLQGINRHSESGILKAHWSGTDCARMKFFPLMFTPEDALLIHHGLEERHSRLLSNGSEGVPFKRSDLMWDRREMGLPVP